MSNRKFSLSKISALVATSAALLAGAVSINSNEVKADSTPVLRFTHNAYKYNSKGKRISKKVIKKGARYFYTKKAKIHGKKYYKLDTKGNVYVKKGNVSVYNLSKTVTLTHNAFQYNSKGKRIKSLPTLKKGDSYFVLGTKYIKGKKFYRVDNNAYIKASNTVARTKTSSTPSNDTTVVANVNDFNQSQPNTNSVTTSQVAQNQSPSNNTNSSVSVNTQTSSNSSNTNNSGSNSQVTNNTHQNTANNSENNVKNNTGSNSGSISSSKTNANANTSRNTPSDSNSSQKQNSQNTNANTNNQSTNQNTTDNTPHTLNRLVFPAGYLQAIKNSNFTMTPEIKKMAEQGMDMNVFHSESASDDNLQIDSDDMTPAQLQEINLFALRLINQARREMGTQQEWVYTERAQSIASRVAWLYEKHGKGISTWHDQDALNQVDQEAGVHTAELLGGSSVTYHEDSLTNMTDLKRAVYNDIVAMLFSNQELEHAKIMTTWTSQDRADQTSFGLDISWLKKNRYGLGEHSEHFIAY